MTVTVMKTYFNRLDPKIGYYRNFKVFHNDLFRGDVLSKLGTFS